MSEVCDVRITSRAAGRRLLFPFVDAGWLQATRRDKRLEDSELPFLFSHNHTFIRCFKGRYRKNGH
jgi:hypothetical protein